MNDKGLLGLASGVFTTALLQPLENIKMALMIPPKSMPLTSNFVTNMRIASIYIFYNNGIPGFYRGLMASTAKAALGCFVYFSMLRNLEKPDQSLFGDFMLSFAARISSTIVTNPLSIIETRYELADFHGYNTLVGAMKDIYQKEGVKGFLAGGLAPCIKEGSFAGFYYMLY